MGAIHKGKRGEVELCKWIDTNLQREDTERNYNQSQGGADIIIEDFMFEVKRRENLDLDSWWHQVIIAKKNHKRSHELIPVVAFRQNRKKWEFLVPAFFIGCDKGYIRLTERIFIEFANKIISGEYAQ